MKMQKYECEFAYMNWYHKHNVYTCCVKNKIIYENAELKLFGKHVNIMTKYIVKGINFSDCVISKFPQGLTKIFPNLKRISIYNSKLKTIEKIDLKEYKNLIYISIISNEISFLPGNLFDGMKNLEGIRIQNNKIEEIEPNLLDGLKKLKFVKFQETKCIDKCFDSIKSNGNATLKEIKDEIRKKFLSPALKMMLKEITKLKQANGELTNAVEAADDKIVKMEQTINFLNILKIRELKQTIPELMNAQKDGICGDLKKVIENENLKDFIIQVDDEEFKVHKLLLAARSPVLKEMIENNIDAECLKLVDISKEIFREILKFIYTDELPQSNDVNFLHLFVAAGRLKIENLKKFATEKLIESVNLENALEILTLANKYENEALRQKSFQIIKDELDETELSDDLALQPEKLREALNLKKEKEKMLREMEMKLKMLLKE